MVRIKSQSSNGPSETGTVRERIPFDRVAECYDFTRESPPPQVIEALASTLKGDPRILEVGVGTGRIARPLLDYGINIVGVDISPRMLSQARSKGLRDLLLGDGLFLPFRDASFSTVIVVHVLHLVPDLQQTLREVTRVSGGRMVTILGEYEPKVSVQEEYRGLVKSLGHESKIGPSEVQLSEKYAPNVKIPAGERRVKRSIDERIDLLEKRAWAITWEVPEQIHRDVILRLREDFGGKIVDYVDRFYVGIWDVAKLRETIRQ